MAIKLSLVNNKAISKTALARIHYLGLKIQKVGIIKSAKEREAKRNLIET